MKADIVVGQHNLKLWSSLYLRVFECLYSVGTAKSQPSLRTQADACFISMHQRVDTIYLTMIRLFLCVGVASLRDG